MAQFPPERRVVRAETILGFLDGLRVKYGSVPGFLGGIGVGEDVLDGLRTRLLACGAEID
jgi:hypothetical protein